MINASELFLRLWSRIGFTDSANCVHNIWLYMILFGIIVLIILSLTDKDDRR